MHRYTQRELERYRDQRILGESLPNSMLVIRPDMKRATASAAGAQLEKTHPQIEAEIERGRAELKANGLQAIKRLDLVTREKIIAGIERNIQALEDMDSAPARVGAINGYAKLGQTIGMFSHGNREAEDDPTKGKTRAEAAALRKLAAVIVANDTRIQEREQSEVVDVIPSTVN